MTEKLQKSVSKVSNQISQAVEKEMLGKRTLCSCGGTLVITSIKGIGDMSKFNDDDKLFGELKFTYKCENCKKVVR